MKKSTIIKSYHFWCILSILIWSIVCYFYKIDGFIWVMGYAIWFGVYGLFINNNDLFDRMEKSEELRCPNCGSDKFTIKGDHAYCHFCNP